MKGIVLYRGKYGATAQYAKWLAEALYLHIVDIDRQFADRLENYDFFIVGSPVYAGKLLMKNWLQKNEAALLKKKLFLFIVSSASPDDKIRQETVIKENLPETLAGEATIFFLRGRVLINKLSWKDKLIVRIGAMLEKDPEKKAMMRRGYDDVKPENIDPLIRMALDFSNSGDIFWLGGAPIWFEKTV